MSPSSPSRPMRLTVERIVDAACGIVERDGLAGLSMRRLGAELAVDPMAVYHHVADKRALLALVMARTIGELAPPDPAAPWDVRVRQWATRYWELVTAHRELTLAGLADAEIAAGGLAATEPLIAAIAESGLPPDLVEPVAFLVVDAVHGSALGAGAPGRRHGEERVAHSAAFELGLGVIIAGIAARVRDGE